MAAMIRQLGISTIGRYPVRKIDAERRPQSPSRSAASYFGLRSRSVDRRHQAGLKVDEKERSFRVDGKHRVTSSRVVKSRL
jgi:hypothetical protein